LGALFLASKRSSEGLLRIIPIATCIFGSGLIAFSQSQTLWLSLVLISIAGFGMMVQTASSNTLLQVITDDDKRGRVMSFHALAFMGTAPFGSLLAGTLANKIGAPNTLTLGGITCILSAILFIAKLKPFKLR
jgi:MFS family permease